MRKMDLEGMPGISNGLTEVGLVFKLTHTCAPRNECKPSAWMWVVFKENTAQLLFFDFSFAIFCPTKEAHFKALVIALYDLGFLQKRAHKWKLKTLFCSSLFLMNTWSVFLPIVELQNTNDEINSITVLNRLPNYHQALYCQQDDHPSKPRHRKLEISARNNA